VEDDLNVHTKVVPFRLPPSPPVFTSGQDTAVPLLYLAQFDSWATFNAIPVENWALVLAQCLRGGASAWFNGELATWTAANRKPTLHTIKEVFLRRWVGQNWQQQVRRCLTKFSFASCEGLSDYCSKVDRKSGV
jgi:hypothetical protein